MSTAGSTREREMDAPANAAKLASCLSGLRAVLADLVEGLVPELVPFAEATSLWSQFAEIERLAGSARLLLARRVSDSRQWSHAGFANPAEWMAAQTGSSVGRARADLGTSERLALLPDVEDAVRSGGLSPEQADLISDAAAVNPEAANELLGAAGRESHKNLKDRCGRRKAEADADPEATRDRIHRARRARCWTDSEGAVNLSARGTVDAFADLRARWERATELRFREARSAGRREPREAYAFDALVDLLGPPAQPISSQPEAPLPEARRPSRVAPKHLALIRVDLSALVRGEVRGGELCEITGLGPIPVATARELLGESILQLVIAKGRDVANVTHLGRGPNAAQKIALLWTHTGCSVAGCSRTLTQDDHRTPFAVCRNTRLGNLDPLCPHHHRLKTHDGWALVAGRGPRDFVPPDHPEHPWRSRGSTQTSLRPAPPDDG